MKVFIEDIVANMEGKPEKELPQNTKIRFEWGFKSIVIGFSDEAGFLKIMKEGQNAIESRVITIPNASNIVLIA